MLSGIRTGKKKKRRATDQPPVESSSRSKLAAADAHDAAAFPSPQRVDKDNLSVAEQLRSQLASGKAPSTTTTTTTKSPSQLSETILPFARLQQEGRIASEQHHAASGERTDSQNNVFVLTADAGDPSRPDYRPEDFRMGSRKGKLKPSYADTAGTLTAHAEMSVQDMIREEHTDPQSMDEVFARNIARVGSRYKGTDLKQSSATGADEEDAVDMNMFQSQRLTTHARQQKERSRQVARHDKEQSITSRCSWWMDSTSFRKHMLVALGNHVSLVMAPAHLSLQTAGDLLYLVPIAHADSLVACEDDVWTELQRFQQSLRDMYAKEGKRVIFTETVLPSSKGLWQTRMECIAVPGRGTEDVQMFFKTALAEQAEEWGTHTKLLSTRDKGLRRTIPKTFPYFYVEWEANRGYAQMIETSSFPKELAPDTLAGMLDLEPIRFRRKQVQSADQERKLVLDFVAKWKPFDWTLRLD